MQNFIGNWFASAKNLTADDKNDFSLNLLMKGTREK